MWLLLFLLWNKKLGNIFQDIRRSATGMSGGVMGNTSRHESNQTSGNSSLQVNSNSSGSDSSGSRSVRGNNHNNNHNHVKIRNNAQLLVWSFTNYYFLFNSKYNDIFFQYSRILAHVKWSWITHCRWRYDGSHRRTNVSINIYRILIYRQ